MTKEEKMKKVCTDFSSLTEEKQDYILGILQALVFAKDEGKEPVKNATPGVRECAD
jgi:hypothetical protein